MTRGTSRGAARLLLLGALVAAMLGFGAASASAVIVTLPGGKTLSYQPLRGAGHARLVRPFDAFFTNLDYNGGPVMPSNTNYVFYWRPAGASEYPADYQPGLNKYFEDLAHDSGGSENVDSVSAQYNDASGAFAKYESHFGGALIDTQPYPKSGCTRAVVCLTDHQIQTELVRFVTANKLPIDLTHEYFLLTPPNVESCFEAGAATTCSAGSTAPFYCAYHGNVPVGGSQLIYSNDPYVTGIGGCDDGNHPNGASSDGALQGGLSHEHNESITDPEPNNAWTDFGANTGEIGDKCAEEGPETGPELGFAKNGAKYNQVINGDFYWYQEEWSNQEHKCMQRFTLKGTAPLATFKATAGAGNEMTFDPTGSTATAGTRYNWQLNEGPEPGPPIETTTTTPSVKHTFAAPGTYDVALTVFRANGTSTGTAQQVVVGDESPSAALSVTSIAPVAGSPVSFDASASKDPDGTISTYEWEFGDGTGAVGAAAARTHTYEFGGLYEVNVLVTDSAGLSSLVTQLVFVEERPELPAGGQSGGGSLPPPPPGGTAAAAAPAASAAAAAPAAPALTATIALNGTSLTVTRNGQLAVALRCAGSAPQCSGSLVLVAPQRFRRAGHVHTRTVTLASARFTIRAGTTTSIKLTLTAVARALLRSDGGHLAATLRAQKSSPGPQQTLIRSVRLLSTRRRR